MNPVAIRFATKDDAAAVCRLAGEMSRRLGTPDDLLDEAAVARDMLADAGPMTVLVAEAEGKVIGFAGLLPGYETTYASPGVYISDLCVEAVSQRRGTGRALMAAAAAFARASGAEHIWLVRTQRNADASAFYDTIADISEPLVGHAVTRDAFSAMAEAGEKLLEGVSGVPRIWKARGQ